MPHIRKTRVRISQSKVTEGAEGSNGDAMKLFHFYRKEDHSGVSGTGPVVEGVQFTNGWCAIRWMSSMSSICFYQSIEEVQKIHGHGGKTEIVIHDFEPLRRRRAPDSNRRFEMLLEIIEEASRLVILADEPDSDGEFRKTLVQLRAAIEHLETEQPKTKFKATG
jgi:hypothetical protein